MFGYDVIHGHRTSFVTNSLREHVAVLKAELARLREQYRDNTGSPVVLAADGS